MKKDIYKILSKENRNGSPYLMAEFIKKTSEENCSLKYIVGKIINENTDTQEYKNIFWLYLFSEQSVAEKIMEENIKQNKYFIDYLEQYYLQSDIYFTMTTFHTYLMKLKEATAEDFSDIKEKYMLFETTSEIKQIIENVFETIN